MDILARLHSQLTLQLSMGTTFSPPANVVCEGYVFKPVCQSFCSQGGGGMRGGGVWQGACVVGDMCGGGARMAGGGMHCRGVCVVGGSVHGRGCA